MSLLCFTLAAACHRSDAPSEPMLGQKVKQDVPASDIPGLYIPEFSKPTGKYVSRLFLRIFNAFLRKGSLVFAGNPCTPGMSVLEGGQEKSTRQILSRPGIRTVVCNFWGTPESEDGIAFQAEPYMWLSLKKDWETLEDYKQAMHSKYRVRVNKAISCSDHLHSAWVGGDILTDEQIACMANLLSATLSNKTLALPPDLKGLIKGFCKEYGKNYKTVFCLDKDQNVMGFLSAVTDRETVFAMHIGYDAAHAREWHLYQRLMLDLIEKCILTGTKNLQLGRTATEIKSTLGAIPLDNSIVVYTRSILLTFILKIYKRFFFKAKTYTLRQPFRIA